MSRRTAAAFLALGLTVAVLTGGCGRVPSSRFYVIEIRHSPDEAPRPAPRGLAIGVAPFHVRPPYDQDRIVYRTAAAAPKVAFYPYDRWAAPLSRMLPAAVAGGLRGMAGVTRVEPAHPGLRHDLVLHGRLDALEEIDLAGGPRVRLVLALDLRDAASGRLLWSGELRGHRDVAAENVEQIVAAMVEVLDGELARVRPAIEAAVGRAEPGRADGAG